MNLLLTISYACSFARHAEVQSRQRSFLIASSCELAIHRILCLPTLQGMSTHAIALSSRGQLNMQNLEDISLL